MVDENKTPLKEEVELDTDGVEDQTVEVEQTKEEPSENSQSFKTEPVDLGYNDVSKQEKKEEIEVQTETDSQPEEKPKDNLKKRQSDYQKRIDELYFTIKESERREKAALAYAKGLKKKYEGIEKKYNETDTNYLKEYGARVDSDRERTKKALKEALEAQDADKIAEANEALARLAVEKEKVTVSMAAKEQASKNIENSQEEQEYNPQQQVPVSEKAARWAEKNAWFGSDRVMTNAAMSLHEDLVMQGIESDSDEYYNNINKRIREYFPHKFAQDSADKEPVATKQPVQNVAGVSRRQGGRKSVKLTKSQVVIAKKLGVPLEEYARYVKGGTNE